MLTTETTHLDHITIITLNGRLDGINAPNLKQTLLAEIANRQGNCIVLEMQEVHYMSAAGLRVLDLMHKQLGYVRIAAPSNRVRDVMQIAGLDVVYEMYATREKACAAC